MANRRIVGLIIILISICSVFALSVQAQAFIHSDYIFERWGVEDGLKVNSVNRIIQTTDGYVWLATFDGLHRFDGKLFTVFASDTHPELIGNRFIHLSEAYDNTMFIIDERNHLILYKNGNFKAVNKNYGIGGNQVLSVFHAPTYSLISTKVGLFRYQQEEFTRYLEDIIKGPVSNISQSETGWIYYRDEFLQLWRADSTQKELLYSDTFDVRDYNPILEEDDGTLWLGSPGGIFQITDAREKKLQFRYSDEYPFIPAQFYRDRRNRLWIAGYRGLGYLDDDRMVFITNNFEERTNLGNYFIESGNDMWAVSAMNLYRNEEVILKTKSRITSFLQDNEGNIWVSTASDGIYRIKEKRVRTIREADGLPHKNVYPILQTSDGTVWAGTMGGGLSKISQDGIKTYTTDDGLLHNHVQSLFEDNNGLLYIGLRAKGAVVYINGNFEHIWPHNISGLIHVYAMHQDKKGNMWFGTQNGIFVSENGTWHHITLENGLAGDFVRYFAEAPDGSLWAATNGGGIAHYQDGVWRSYNTDNGLHSLFIRSLFIADNSDFSYELWVGSQDRGLMYIPVKNGIPDFEKSAIIRTEHGLPDNGIHKMMPDLHGNLWMSSNRGIFFVEYEQLSEFADGSRNHINSLAFDEDDGMANREANGGVQSSGFRHQNGSLWFPTQDGIVIIDPENLNRNSHVPPVYVEELRTADSSYFRFKNPVKLSKYERNLEFYFTSLSYVSPGKNRFRVKLDGFDDIWREVGDRRVVYYTNLPPGDYVFRVQASNNDGIWNLTGDNLAIIIPPFFHERIIFRLLLALMIFLLGAAFYRLRIQNMRKIDQLKLQIASDLHDEIGSNLGSISIKSRLSNNVRNIPENIAALFQDIDRISLETAQSMRDIVWLIKPENDKLDDLNLKMKDTINLLLPDHEVVFEASELNQEKILDIKFRKSVLLLFKEAVHNIQKHANADKVSIISDYNNGKYRLDIRDNGLGFDMNAAKEKMFCNGLENMKHRAIAIDGKLQITSTVGEGTQVFLLVDL